MTFGYSDLKTYRTVTAAKVTFLIIFLLAYLCHGLLMKFSTGGIFGSHEHSYLMTHLCATLIWTVVTSYLTTRGFYAFHRQVGYIAVFSGFVMSGTAYSMVLLDYQKALSEDVAFTTYLHVLFHSFSNLTVATNLLLFLGHGVSKARKKDRRTHSEVMSMAHYFVFDNIKPRVFALILRWAFPYTWMDGNLSFSLACVLQWILHIRSLSMYRDEMARWFLVKALVVSCSLATFLMFCEWLGGFLNCFSIFGLVFAFFVGYFNF